MGVIFRRLCVHSVRDAYARRYSAAPTNCRCTVTHRCKLLVVGGGTGGCSVAWRFARRLKDKDIIVLEPSSNHYYQPLFTLVAAGVKGMKDSYRPVCSVLPPSVTWLPDCVQDFDPAGNTVQTSSGDKICYQYMVVAMGLKNDYDSIPGLKKALNDPSSNVSTIYDPEYCCKTWCCMKNFRGGNALFTFPEGEGKCSGAAQKIMYLADDYWRKHKNRQMTSITYMTGNRSLFGVPKYAEALGKVARSRGIAVNTCATLAEIGPRGAMFLVGHCRTPVLVPYNFLHVTPRMCPPLALRNCPDLATDHGHLDVDMYTLQHARYPNIFGLGDCTSTPNSKTAAAIAVQSHVLEQNLWALMEGKELKAKYNGYGACTLLTSYRTGILAEFLYDKKIHETFPFDQSKESRLIYFMKKNLMPNLYWNKLIKGYWDGPEKLRKIINPMGR